MSDAWTGFLSTIDASDRTIFVVGTWAVHLLSFWVFNAILFVFYHYNLFPERRILGGVMPSKELIGEALRHLAFNHLIVIPAALYFSFSGFTSWGMQVRAPIPSIGIILRDLLFSVAVNDTMFYWMHRLAHHPALYKHVHKQHHKFNRSIGIASEFAHPVEDVLANTLPTILGCLLLGSHVVTLWIWLGLRILETVDTHSGYNFSLSPFSFFSFQGGAERHDFHHSVNTGCYGSMTIFWDHLMGTDLEFHKHQEKKKLLLQEDGTKKAA